MNSQYELAESLTMARGTFRKDFRAAADTFDQLLREDHDFGAQFCVYWRGEPVIDLWGGVEARRGSVTGVWSASKGVAAICLSVLIDAGELDLDMPVAYYWPEFGANGKQHITVRDALTHRAGVIGVPGGFTQHDLASGSSARDKLAAVKPYWRPGALFGYHAITIGMLMEALFLAIRGETLQEFYAREIRDRRQIDFFLGLPEAEEHRYVHVRPPVPPNERLTDADSEASAPQFAWGGHDSLTAVAMNLNGPPAETGVPGDLSPNIPGIRRYGGSGHAGTGTAHGLARLYAMSIGEVDGFTRLLSPRTIDIVSTLQSHGTDLILGAEMGFGIVFMKPVTRLPFASHGAFGHDGAGGALGFADPAYALGFGWVPYPMQLPGGADPKAIALSAAVRAIIRDMNEGAVAE